MFLSYGVLRLIADLDLRPEDIRPPYFFPNPKMGTGRTQNLPSALSIWLIIKRDGKVEKAALFW